jgi:hypothetical protein
MTQYCPQCSVFNIYVAMIQVERLEYFCGSCGQYYQYDYINDVWYCLGQTRGANNMAYGRRRFYNTNRSSTSADSFGTVTVTWNPDIEAYECCFPFNQQFIDWIKSQIPVNKRSYDYDRSRPAGQQHKWMFEQFTLENVILPMLHATFPAAVFKVLDKKKVDEYNQGYKKPTVPVDKNKLKEEFHTLIREAGVPTDIPDRKQYLKAAMFYHPDRNPDNASKMSRLNQLWTEVFVEREQEQQSA